MSHMAASKVWCVSPSDGWNFQQSFDLVHIVCLSRTLDQGRVDNCRIRLIKKWIVVSSPVWMLLEPMVYGCVW